MSSTWKLLLTTGILLLLGAGSRAESCMVSNVVVDCPDKCCSAFPHTFSYCCNVSQQSGIQTASDDSDDKLYIGIGIGVGIAVFIGILILVGALIYLCVKKGAERRVKPSTPVDIPPAGKEVVIQVTSVRDLSLKDAAAEESERLPAPISSPPAINHMFSSA